MLASLQVCLFLLVALALDSEALPIGCIMALLFLLLLPLVVGAVVFVVVVVVL